MKPAGSSNRFGQSNDDNFLQITGSEGVSPQPTSTPKHPKSKLNSNASGATLFQKGSMESNLSALDISDLNAGDGSEQHSNA